MVELKRHEFYYLGLSRFFLGISIDSDLGISLGVGLFSYSFNWTINPESRNKDQVR